MSTRVLDFRRGDDNEQPPHSTLLLVLMLGWGHVPGKDTR